MAYGGKVFNQVAPNALPDHVDAPKHKVKKVLQPTSRAAANIEAEKGETAFILNEDGLPAHYKIGGKRHSEGGTPLNVPEDTFIFSDTKGMIIKDPQILAQFGETKPRTPAKIAEKYDMNEYRKVLSDKSTDDVQKKTAEKMIENYTMLLGKLALVQESSKGFPQGIPMISQPYMIMNNIKPEDILPKPDNQQPQQPQLEEAEAMEEGPMPQMAMFGYEAPPMMPSTYFANGGSSMGRMVRITRTPQYSYGGGFLTKAQKGLTTADSLNKAGVKVIKFEDTMGGPGGSPTSGYNQEDLMKIMNYNADRGYGNAENIAKVSDWLWRSGWDESKMQPTFNPKAYILGEYYRKYKKYDPKDWDDRWGWTGRSSNVLDFDKLYSDTVSKLPADEQQRLINLAQDWFYKNRYPSGYTPKKDASGKFIRDEYGAIHPDYKNVWAPGIRNTYDIMTPFDKNAIQLTDADKINYDEYYRNQTVPKAQRKEYGGGISKFQVGGTRKDTYDYVSSWAQEYLNKSKSGLYEPELPATLEDPELRTRVSTQGAIPGYLGAFGDMEIINNFNEFKARHNWFFKDHPGLTIQDFLKNYGKGKGGLIEKFQKAYNDKAKEYGLPEYFTTDGPAGTKLDAVYGEHTYSAPGFNPPKKKPVADDKTVTDNTIDTTIDVEEPETRPDIPYAWFPQDIINLGVAASTKIPRIKTFYEPLQFRTPDVAYLRENYSPMLAAEATGVEGAMAYAQKPAAFAMTSALAGKTAAEAAKHNLDIANLNAEKYDKASLLAANVANANAEYNSKLKMQDFDARQLYERDRIMAQNKKRAQIAKAINTGITNAAAIYNLNQINQQYAIDPSTGGLVAYVNPKMLVPDENASINSRLNEFKMWQDNTDLSDEQIVALMKARDEGSYDNTALFTNPYEYATLMAKMMSNQGE